MIGELLNKQRNLLGYSQQQVADKTGVDRSYYSKIESGLIPSVKVAKAIGKELGVDWTLFFEQVSAKNTQKEVV